MRISKNTDFSEPRSADELSDEILRVMALATQALDGSEMSDAELDVLCDEVLSEEALLGRKVKTASRG